MNKSVLITGASMGFGPAISIHLAEEGFKVYAGVADSQGTELIRSKAFERGVEIFPIPLVLSDLGSIQDAVDFIVEQDGGVHGLINSAGILLRGFFEDLEEDEIRALFEINFFATLSATRAVLPVMRKARQGRIVIISSVAGRVGTLTGSAYSATRFAQEGFAESLYQETAPLGIRVVLIEPGITETPTWTLERSAGRKTHNSDSPYYQWFLESERRFGKKLAESRIEPLDIARHVHRALTDPRPRLRYVVGSSAKGLLCLRRYLPGEIFHRIFLREVTRRIGSLNASK